MACKGCKSRLWNRVRLREPGGGRKRATASVPEDSSDGPWKADSLQVHLDRNQKGNESDHIQERGRGGVLGRGLREIREGGEHSADEQGRPDDSGFTCSNAGNKAGRLGSANLSAADEAEYSSMTFGQEFAAKLNMAMSRDPEADEGVMRGRIANEVSIERKRRDEVAVEDAFEGVPEKTAGKPKSITDLLSGGFIKKGI